MNDRLRLELERLKERQAQLHHAIDLLGVHIAAMEKRLGEEEGKRSETVLGVPTAGPTTGVPMAVPPLLAEVGNIQLPTVASAQPATSNLEPATVVQPLTPSVSPSDGERVAEGRIGGMDDITTRSRSPAGAPIATPSLVPPIAFTPPPAAAASAPAKPDSFEMRLGTYWLVRIGIVAMLTALVFFGSYAYQNYIGKIGPGGKVALLYLASGALLGFGAWFQRRAATEALRNYAQVLLAGGMAAVYFTTYAAHHFPNLRVITSEKLDGVLLLAWAAFMAWTADRKKSEVFAMFAVGLAFYSSAITHVGYFTLYSNLVLAAAALFFLVRNRWAKLSFASLVATYASYGFWRFYANEGWQWAGPEANADLWAGVYFLAAYWAVFTAAVFLSQHKEFAGVNRASFITLNNGAFYVMFLLTMWQVHSGSFWRFNVITGAVLLGAAAFAKIRLRDEPLAANTYLTQGLLLVTIGFIAKFSGQQLALVLALESVTLWMVGTLRKNIIMRTGACVSAALATVWAFDGINRNDVRGAWLGAGVGALMAFNAFWAHWREQRNNPKLLRASPTYFSALAMLVWAFAIFQNVERVNRPTAFALAALVLVASVYLTRLRELSLLGQLLLPISAFYFMSNQARPLAGEFQPWWGFACVAGVALALVHWWQKQSVVESPRELRIVGQFVPALILVGVATSWLSPKLDMMQWVLANSALVLVVTAYGAVMRNWVLALVAQIFGAVAVVNLLFQAGTIHLPWVPGLAPLAALTVLAIGGRRWADAHSVVGQASCLSSGADEANISPDRQDACPTTRSWVRNIAVWYGRAAMALLIYWTFSYVNEPELVWSFTALGVAAFAIAGWRKDQDFLVFTTALNLCALYSLAAQLLNGTAVYWPNFLAVLAWMVKQQTARRQGERYPVPAMAHNVAMVAAGVALWFLVSRWVGEAFTGHFYLTASWSLFAFAIIAAGVLLRERVYRWLGLVIIGVAVGRAVLFDVWKLEQPIYRIVSFFALGAVLLVLGFIYNKYQERLRQWL